MSTQQTQHQDVPDVAPARQARREAFLAAHGLAGAEVEPMQADASFRRYYRLTGAARPLLLMEDPPDRPPVPPYVMIAPFVRIAGHLRALGLHAPEVFAMDEKKGLALLEDFGDDTFTRLFERGENPRPLYEQAVDALALLHAHPRRNDLALPPYDAETLAGEALLLTDWYLPALTGAEVPAAARGSFAAVWRDLAARFPRDQQTLVLRDYHVDNLMRLPGGACGLLDFQDALEGPFSYDLMSLLEDARRDVPQDLQAHLRDRYFGAMGPGLDRAAFDFSYRVLAAQRHAKVLGIFVRLARRDGKKRYLQFIPHVRKLFLRALEGMELAPLRQWFDDNEIDMQKGLPT